MIKSLWEKNFKSVLDEVWESGQYLEVVEGNENQVKHGSVSGWRQGGLKLAVTCCPSTFIGGYLSLVFLCQEQCLSGVLAIQILLPSYSQPKSLAKVKDLHPLTTLKETQLFQKQRLDDGYSSIRQRWVSMKSLKLLVQLVSKLYIVHIWKLDILFTHVSIFLFFQCILSNLTWISEYHPCFWHF